MWGKNRYKIDFRCDKQEAYICITPEVWEGWASRLTETPCKGNHLHMASPAFEFTNRPWEGQDDKETFRLSEFTCLGIKKRTESIITG